MFYPDGLELSLFVIRSTTTCSCTHCNLISVSGVSVPVPSFRKRSPERSRTHTDTHTHTHTHTPRARTRHPVSVSPQSITCGRAHDPHASRHARIASLRATKTVSAHSEGARRSRSPTPPIRNRARRTVTSAPCPLARRIPRAFLAVSA